MGQLQEPLAKERGTCRPVMTAHGPTAGQNGGPRASCPLGVAVKAVRYSSYGKRSHLVHSIPQ